jgi:isochorismate synthase EntC
MKILAFLGRGWVVHKAVEFSFATWLEQGAIIGKVGKWVEVSWGAPQSHASEESLANPAIYRTSFFHELKEPWLEYPFRQRLTWKDWKQLVIAEIKLRPAFETELDWIEPNEKNFLKVFLEIKKEMKSKTVDKAVPVVTAQAIKSKPPELAVLKALKLSPVNTYVYGCWSSEEGFFGFSPEVLFLREKKNVIKTMALAGTRKKEHYLQDPEDFLKDPKEIKEHQFVVDDIVKRLDTLGKVKIGKTSFLELNFLTHLYTPLQVTTNESISFTRLIEVLHPTPALGVVPRSQMSLLKRWRDQTEMLGAPFGIRWSESEYLALVAIRKIQWNKTHYFIGSGCGVVEESDFDEEWQELRLKRESVRRTFQL